MKFIQFAVLVLSVVISAGFGLAAKFSHEWNKSTVAYFAMLNNEIDNSVQETLTGITQIITSFLVISSIIFFSFYLFN